MAHLLLTVALLSSCSSPRVYYIQTEVLELNHIEPAVGGMGFIVAQPRHQLIAWEWTAEGHMEAVDWMWVPGHIGQFGHDNHLIMARDGYLLKIYYRYGFESWSTRDREIANRALDIDCYPVFGPFRKR